MMTDIKQLAKAQCYKLTPFLIAVLLYFALIRRRDSLGLLWTTILKCLPIVALIIFIISKGFAFKRAYKRSQYILLGLVFSCGGDALLNVNLFIFGMISFGVAHIFYIAAFGWQPKKWCIGLALYLPVTIFTFVIHKNLDALLAVGVPIYCAIIATMLWRAVARAVVVRDTLSILCAVGAALFVISDALIAVTMFMAVPIKHAGLHIMITYYAAQFAIALSTVNDGPELIVHKTKKQ